MWNKFVWKVNQLSQLSTTVEVLLNKWNKCVSIFTNDVKKPIEPSMLCIIDGKPFFLFMENTWIGDSDASCHNTNDDTSLDDVIDINKLIQCNSGRMSATKKGKLLIKVYQVNGGEK